MRAVLFLSLTLLSLAACGGPASGPRDTSVQMKAMVGIDPARLDGQWREVAGIGRTSQGAPWRIGTKPNAGLIVEGPDGVGEGSLSATGKVTLSTFPAPLYLIWIDADNRTVILGSTAGAPAIVLDRADRLPADRATAVRDILAWNGYDTDRLR